MACRLWIKLGFKLDFCFFKDLGSSPPPPQSEKAGRRDSEDGMEGRPVLVTMRRPVNGGHSVSQGSDDKEEVRGNHSMEPVGLGYRD